MTHNNNSRYHAAFPPLKALVWFMFSLVFGCLNDAIAKYLSANMNYISIGFFRFFLGSIVLLPYVLRQKVQRLLKSTNFTLHIVRGGILALSIYLYIRALHGKNITIITLIGFTKPILILILAKFLLHEQIVWTTWLLVAVTFISVLLSLKIDSLAYNLPVFYCLLANTLFALLEIINKKYVNQESMANMLFFSAFFAALWMMILGWSHITRPTFPQLSLLIMLALSSNALLVCILYAFKFSDASLLAPFSYVEFFISSLLGYLFFHELPDLRACIGVSILIPTAYFVYWYQYKRR